MAIGGLGAIVLFRKWEKLDSLDFLFSKRTQIFVLGILAVILIRGITLPHEFYSLLFLVVILNLVANPKSIIRFDSALLYSLGKVSYGLYMFHSVSIFLTLTILIALGLNHGGVFENILIYVFSLLTTCFFAYVSYYLYERHFLKLKSRFAKVKAI